MEGFISTGISVVPGFVEVLCLSYSIHPSFFQVQPAFRTSVAHVAPSNLYRTAATPHGCRELVGTPCTPRACASATIDDKWHMAESGYRQHKRQEPQQPKAAAGRTVLIKTESTGAIGATRKELGPKQCECSSGSCHIEVGRNCACHHRQRKEPGPKCRVIETASAIDTTAVTLIFVIIGQVCAHSIHLTSPDHDRVPSRACIEREHAQTPVPYGTDWFR